jgi:hypothetical protein
MNKRIRDLPVYATRRTEIPAPRFNRARLALLRLGGPLALHVEPLKHMAVIVDDDAWICVDEVLNEYPIVAWTDFDTVGRSSLHEAVKCRVLLFHEHAERILDIVLDNMDRMLAERLSGLNRGAAD